MLPTSKKPIAFMYVPRVVLTALSVNIPLSALAQTSPTLEVYGRANVSVDYYQGGENYSAADLASNSSRIGMRAEHDLDTGLKLLGQISQSIYFNRGRGADWASRSALLGLKDAWGTIKIGYMGTILKDLRSDTDLYSGQLGDSRNILRGPRDPHLDDRMRSSIRYSSPQQLGWGVEMQYSFDTEDKDTNPPADDNQFNAYSALLRYQGESFWIAVGGKRFSGADPSINRRSGTGYRLGLGVDLTEGFTLCALGQITQDSYPFDDNGNEGFVDATGGGLGLKYQLADDLELLGQYYAMDAERSGYGARMAALGTVFHADKQTRFYATFATLNNNSHTHLAPWIHGRTAGPELEKTATRKGATSWGISSGVRFDF